MLKKAYPDIGDVTVSFIDDPISSRLAAYAPEQNMILFNRQHPDWRRTDTPLNVAVHELQHYVQGKELFTQGESFTKTLNENELFTQSNEAMPLVIAKALPESLQFAKQFKGIGFDKDSIVDAIAGFTAKDGLSARASLTKAFRSKDMADKFITNAQKYPALSGVLEIKDISSAAYQKSIADYMGVAGEVFARQTEQRRGMSATERAASPAMQAIETDPLNRRAGITIDNMTAPRAGTTEQAADYTINPGRTQRSNTTPTYEKAFDLLNVGEGDTVLDYGAGMGLGSIPARKRGANVVTFEPIPPKDFTPDFTNAADIPEAVANKAVNMNVLNVLPPAQRNEAVTSIGRSLMPNGEAIINVRSAAEVNAAKNKIKSEDGFIIGSGKERTFQKGFTQKELKEYVSNVLGEDYTVESVSGLSGATVKIKKLQSTAPTQFADPFAMQVPQSTIPEGM